MPDGQTIKTYSAADIEKYHKGLLSPSAMHEMEKAALDDPFLADAMEGYNTAGLSVTAEITDLKERLAKRIAKETKTIPLSGSNRTSFPWMRAAVMVGVLAGAGVLTYLFMFRENKTELAVNDPVKKEEIRPGGSGSAETKASPANTVNNGFTTATDSAVAKTTEKTDLRTGNLVKDKQPAEQAATEQSSKLEEVAAVPGAIARDEVKKDTYYETDQAAKPQVIAADKEMKKAVAGNGYLNIPAPAQNKQAAQPQRADDFANLRSNIFRGRVTDASNLGVPFAKVINTEDNVGTYTDARGYFNLTSPDSVLNVQVRSIGFENSNTQLRNVVPNNQVVLQDDRKTLNALVISNQKTNAQARSRNNNVNLQEPEPADGWDNYDTYIANNLEIPSGYQPIPNMEAVVQVSFEVDKSGEPVNFKVEKSLCEKCDKEAIRLIKEGPKWKRKARAGRTTVSIPFNQLF